MYFQKHLAQGKYTQTGDKLVWQVFLLHSDFKRSRQTKVPFLRHMVFLITIPARSGKEHGKTQKKFL